jgi:hypothetical protein
MKKLLLIVAVIGLVFASCKKDRVCSCKIVTSYTGTPIPPFKKPNDNVTDYNITLVSTGLITARRACVHTKQTSEIGYGITENVDQNCSLK